MVDRFASSGSRSSQLRSVLAAVQCSHQTDGELLTKFVASRDEGAFAELVRRLGPVVYGVCRRFLGNTTDADDAFQVVFLVLARKADTVRPPGKVAAWLHGVAILAARKAAAEPAGPSGRSRLRTARSPHAGSPWTRTSPRSWTKLNRLPDRFRLPILLANPRTGPLPRRRRTRLAARYGASRLSRGRILLANRLGRRG